jgi:hypothetical protein
MGSQQFHTKNVETRSNTTFVTSYTHDTLKKFKRKIKEKQFKKKRKKKKEK